MLMPGDNATKHWALGSTYFSEGMWHGDSALCRRRHHGHLLWPDQRHELLVHRRRRPWYGQMTPSGLTGAAGLLTPIQ